ncbi:uncharacterized protein VTP21DRAFT_10707 [Calcarisporiella thermophila]|uniref:uncharacterized protein n=1 Tax=Calcarisporiella thermophila TaxID=911321 RepID=UPI0037444197
MSRKKVEPPKINDLPTVQKLDLATEEGSICLDPNVLLLSLIQSRQQWTSTIFSKYKREPARTFNRAIANKKATSSGVLYLGSASLYVGPHVFPGTKFFEVTWIEPVTTKNGSNGDIEATHHTNPTASSSSPADLDNSTATNNNSMFTNGIQLPISHPQSTVKPMVVAPSDIFTALKPTAPAPAVEPAPTPIIVRDIVMEFAENPAEKWLLPKDMILEVLTTEEPLEILASFCVSSTNNQLPHGGAKKSTQHQPVTMRISGASYAIWNTLQRASDESNVAQDSIKLKLKQVPNRVYLQYYSRSSGSTDEVEVTESDQHYKLSQSIANEYNGIKRKLDTIDLLVSRSKKSRSLNLASSFRKEIPTKKTTIKKSTPRSLQTSSVGIAGPKRCGYCGTKTTPMWRRGPLGPSTLCNACGVKWKQGKILKDVEIVSGTLQADGDSPIGRKSSSSGPKRAVKDDGTHTLSGSKFMETPKPGRPPKTPKSPSTKRTKSGILTESVEGVTEEETKEIIGNGGKHETHPAREDIATAADDASQPKVKGQRRRSSTKERKPRKSLTNANMIDDNAPQAVRKKIRKSSITSAYIMPTTVSVQENSADTIPSPAPQPSHSPNTSVQPISSASNVSNSAAAPLPPSLVNAACTNSPQKQPSPTGTSLQYPITLPTVSLSFEQKVFTHPNCQIMLHSDHFKMQLGEPGRERVTVDVAKRNLEAPQFQLMQQEVSGTELVMKLNISQVITLYGRKLINPASDEKHLVCRFREKLLDNQIGVVQKLLERWFGFGE